MSEPASAPMARLRALVQQRAPWLILLVLVALCYYGSYYRHGLNFKDEGGTEVLVAKRLLEGQRPFLETTLGYNVMWYYPMVWLYELTGVSFVALRVYCFALSTLTAVLGFLTVERAGRRPWLAFLVALMLVLVPGMTHKNYMPLLAVANACCLLHFALGARPDEPQGRGRAWKWMTIGGVVLGLTFLIRIDLGLFALVLWLGGIALTALHWRRAEKPAAALALGGPLLVVGLAVLVHLPVCLDAQRRGFAEPFLAQYTAWPKSLVLKAGALFGKNPAPALPRREQQKTASSAATPQVKAAVPPPAKPAKTGTLRRKTWSDFLRAEKWEEQLLVILLYLPIPFALLLAGWATVRLARAYSARDADGSARGLGALLLIGAGLTTFPQYFFFRPDSPHLSEFSPGYWAAVAGACLLLGSWRSWAVRVLAALLVLHAGLYLWRMLPDRWTGTIAVRKSRTFRFRAKNGVDVMLSRREVDALRPMQQLIQEHSKPGEYLVAYPYHPTVNVLADRPSYEKNVYVDNVTGGPRWPEEAIKRLQQFKPAIVVVSDWNINGTEESRFSVWAEKTKTWIQLHYTYRGTYLEMELYTRNAPRTE